jgi:citrate synthase
LLAAVAVFFSLIRCGGWNQRVFTRQFQCSGRWKIACPFVMLRSCFEERGCAGNEFQPGPVTANPRGRNREEWSQAVKDPVQKPSPWLVAGLHRLVGDLQKAAAADEFSLTGHVCGSTSLLSFPADGVSYMGCPVQSLVQSRRFEDVAWLLLHGQLPGAEQMADWESHVSESASALHESIGEVFSLLPVGARPLDLLQLSMSLLSFFDPAPNDLCVDSSVVRVCRILGQLPELLNYAINGVRAKDSIAVLTELGELSWSGRLLRILRGGTSVPTPEEDAAMNALMICQCLTEMRPACFGARSTAAATRNVITALQSATTVFVGQTINDPWQWTSELLRSFVTPDQAEAWYRSREPQGMPFGFAAHVPDARVRLLRESAGTLLGSVDRLRIAAAAARLEKILATGNQLPTLDWAAVRLMTLLDIPADRQALAVGVARVVGWSAHAIEQQKSGISLLPALRYGQEE